MGVATTTVDAIKLLKAKKGRAVKNAFKQFDFVIASKEIMPQIPKLIGPVLARMGKFPIGVQTSFEDAIKNLDTNVGMTSDELRTNLTASLGNILSTLPKGYDNLKS